MAHHVATLAIACSQLDAGQIIDRHDRPIADFRDTELSTKISDIFVHFLLILVFTMGMMNESCTMVTDT